MRLIARESMDYTVRGQLVELRTGKPVIVDDEIAAALLEKGFAQEEFPEDQVAADAFETEPEPEATEEDGVDEIDLDEILAGTARDVADEIADGDHDGYLDELEDAETARNKPRKGVLDAIDERRAALS